jgi:hypothetical protein
MESCGQSYGLHQVAYDVSVEVMGDTGYWWSRMNPAFPNLCLQRAEQCRVGKARAHCFPKYAPFPGGIRWVVGHDRPCTSPRRNQCRSGGVPMKPQGWSPNDGWFCWPGADDPERFLKYGRWW